MADSFDPTVLSNVTTTGSQTGTQSGIQNTQGTTSGTQAQQGTNANTFNAGQTALQNNLGGLYGSLAAGNIPTSYTANPNLVGAYETAYNQNVAPGEAAQGGWGSPAIASNNAMGLQALLANQYNTGVSNYQNTLAGASNFASNPFLGNSSSSTGSGSSTSIGSQQTNTDTSQNSTQNQQTQSPASMYAALMNILSQSPYPQGSGASPNQP